MPYCDCGEWCKDGHHLRDHRRDVHPTHIESPLEHERGDGGINMGALR